MLRQPDRTRWERLVDTPLPEWIQIQQTFPSIEEKDVTAAVRRELSRLEIRHYLRPGLSVAIGVGSRGLASLRTLVATTVAVLKEAGCSPSIVPAMGSHGGANAAGQREILAKYGITEATVAAPICSSMEVVEIRKLSNGLLVYFDKGALSADLLIPINRIKPHTSFATRSYREVFHSRRSDPRTWTGRRRTVDSRGVACPPTWQSPRSWEERPWQHWNELDLLGTKGIDGVKKQLAAMLMT